jgi:hypothetical protein
MSASSKYVFQDRPDGFTVAAPDRCTTHVALHDGMCWTVCRDGEVSAYDRATYGLCEYYALSRRIAEELMHDWHPRQEPRSWPGIKRWATDGVAGAIGKQAHERWQRLLDTVDPTVLAVHKAVFAATMGCGPVLFEPELYTRRWVVRDIVRYRAAAVAASQAQALAQNLPLRRAKHSALYVELKAELEALRRRAEDAGFTLHSMMHPWGDRPLPEIDAVDALEEWRALFSIYGEPYTSLDRTLMNLPGGVPASLVCLLCHVRLARPYTERLPLLALLAYVQVVRERYGCDNFNGRVFANATTDELKRAVTAVGKYRHADLSHRKTVDVLSAIRFLADYPEPHHGRLGGLVDKAIRWHRDGVAEEARKIVEELGTDTPVAQPNVLPAIPGVRFLDTVGAVCEEGAALGHCVATYATDAVRGHTYLFHVEHAGDQATVQMAPDGRIVQARGPHNQKNGAATWGRRTLGQWARGADLGEPRALSEATVLQGAIPDDIPF